jgi:ATP-dependent Clp protease ATP-binding subunit ClpX
MLNVMYDIPSKPEIKEVIINKEVITEDKEPMVVIAEEDIEALAG